MKRTEKTRKAGKRAGGARLTMDGFNRLMALGERRDLLQDLSSAAECNDVDSFARHLGRWHDAAWADRHDAEEFTGAFMRLMEDAADSLLKATEGELASMGVDLGLDLD